MREIRLSHTEKPEPPLERNERQRPRIAQNEPVATAKPRRARGRDAIDNLGKAHNAARSRLVGRQAVENRLWHATTAQHRPVVEVDRIYLLRGMDQDRPPVVGPPGSVFHVLVALDDESAHGYRTLNAVRGSPGFARNRLRSEVSFMVKTVTFRPPAGKRIYETV